MRLFFGVDKSFKFFFCCIPVKKGGSGLFSLLVKFVLVTHLLDFYNCRLSGRLKGKHKQDYILPRKRSQWIVAWRRGHKKQGQKSCRCGPCGRCDGPKKREALWKERCDGFEIRLWRYSASMNLYGCNIFLVDAYPLYWANVGVMTTTVNEIS